MTFRVFSFIQERLYGLLSKTEWKDEDELSEATGYSVEIIRDVLDTLKVDGFVWVRRSAFDERGCDVWSWLLR